jgi:hypothetical protein
MVNCQQDRSKLRITRALNDRGDRRHYLYTKSKELYQPLSSSTDAIFFSLSSPPEHTRENPISPVSIMFLPPTVLRQVRLALTQQRIEARTNPCI